ncbi:hypothetical protein AA313_de0204546 [Arthrobotrys entomopaga]|nr:hypothetical protein AA313_de0204546 [Arthrobotrys entomopaga]
MNALDPTGKQASAFYSKFVNYAVLIKFFTSPYIGDTDELRTYIFDSMHELAMRVLDNDPSLDPDLKAGILSDLKPLLDNKVKEAKAQVALLKDNMQYMSTLLFKQINAIKNGFSFRGVDALMSSIEGTVHPDAPTNWPKTFKCIRAVAIAGLIGGLLTTSLATIVNWGSASEGQKWLSVSSVVQTLSTTFRMLRYFKLNPIKAVGGGHGGVDPDISRSGHSSLLLDDMQGHAIGENLMRQQPFQPVLEGQNRIRLNSASSHYSGSTADTLESVSTRDTEHIGPLVQNEPRLKFNVGYGLLKGLDILAGIGFVVGMSLELRDHFADMDGFQATFAIIQVVVQGLIVLVDIATLGVELAASFGFMGTELAATACMSLASIGAILGVIAIVAMLALMIYDLVKPKPKTEAEKFIEANKGFIDNLPAAPKALLSYTATPTSVPHGQSSTIVIMFTNATEKELTVRQIGFQIEGGSISRALFQNKSLVEGKSSGSFQVSAVDDMTVYFQGSTTSKILSLGPKPADNDAIFFTGIVAPAPTTNGQVGKDLVFSPGESCSLTINGYTSEYSGEVAITMTEEQYMAGTKNTDTARQVIKIKKT